MAIGDLARRDDYPIELSPLPQDLPPEAGWQLGALASQTNYRPLGNNPWTNTMAQQPKSVEPEERPNPLIPFSAYRSKPPKHTVGEIAAQQLIEQGPLSTGLGLAMGTGLRAAGLSPLARSAVSGSVASAEPTEAQAAKLKLPAGFAPGSLFEPKAPAIWSRANPAPSDIEAVLAAAREYGRKGWPTAEREAFRTTPEAYAETTALVPQISVKGQLPGPLPGEALPNKGRADVIVQNTEGISDRIAERLEPMVKAGDERLKFYHTGPVIRGLEQYGEMPVGDANLFMRNWSGQGAATSPRTQTPPNLRNSSFLTYQRESGNPLTPERYAAEGNTPGFPMMGMHVDLADKFARGVENPYTNPKPFTFRENWSGNLRDVTGDTHNIRSTLYEMDQLQPGSLPRGWFTSDASYAKYREQGFRAIDPGDIADTLGDKTVKGIRRQSEYLPMTEPWYRAAEKVGIAPAEAQSGGWFSYGDITGLQSPPKTITNLLNDQIDATAKALGISPEKTVNWWSRGKIPLAAIGSGLMAPGVIGDLARQHDEPKKGKH